MSVTLTGTNGLFTRVGKMVAGLNEINTYRGVTAVARANSILDEFNSDELEAMDGFLADLSGGQAGLDSWASAMSSRAQAVLIEMVDDDADLINLDLGTALDELIDQMDTASESIDAPTVSVSASEGGSNTGDAAIIASIINPANGLQLDTVIAETIEGTVTASAQTGGATAGVEPIQLVGNPSADLLSHLYPRGSGTSTAIQAIDASQQTVQLVDGSFEGTWVSTNTPPSPWVVHTGTPGTSVFRSSSAVKGNFALRIRGDGSEQTRIYQPLTVSNLRPFTTYAFHAFIKTAGSPSAGVLRARLTDGTNVINDAASTANEIDADLTAVGTSYESFGGFFRTPAVLTEAVQFELFLSTALSSGDDVIIDHCAVLEPTQLYALGPYVSIFSGGTNLAVDDSFTVTVNNDWDKASFVMGLERLWGLRSLGRVIPASGSPTINDSLVT